MDDIWTMELNMHLLVHSEQKNNFEGLKEWMLTFLHSPVELLSTTSGRVSGVRLERNRIEASALIGVA